VTHTRLWAMAVREARALQALSAVGKASVFPLAKMVNPLT